MLKEANKVRQEPNPEKCVPLELGCQNLRTKPGGLLTLRKGHVEGTHTQEWRNVHDTLQLFQCSKKKVKKKKKGSFGAGAGGG